MWLNHTISLCIFNCMLAYNNLLLYIKYNLSWAVSDDYIYAWFVVSVNHAV